MHQGQRKESRLYAEADHHQNHQEDEEDHRDVPVAAEVHAVGGSERDWGVAHGFARRAHRRRVGGYGRTHLRFGRCEVLSKPCLPGMLRGKIHSKTRQLPHP